MKKISGSHEKRSFRDMVSIKTILKAPRFILDMQNGLGLGHGSYRMRDPTRLDVLGDFNKGYSEDLV